MALMVLETYNTIPNVTSQNNKFLYDGNKVLELDPGSYEIADIIEFLEQKLNPSYDDIDEILRSFETPDSKAQNKQEKVITVLEKRATFQIQIQCKYAIDFAKKGSIGRILGFAPRILEPDKQHTSDFRVKLFEIDTILVSTNVTGNWYYNNKHTHSIYQSVIGAPPGNRLNIQPKHLIYFPIITRNLDGIVFKIADQNHNIIDFAGGFITLCAHIRRSHGTRISQLRQDRGQSAVVFHCERYAKKEYGIQDQYAKYANLLQQLGYRISKNGPARSEKPRNCRHYNRAS